MNRLLQALAGIAESLPGMKKHKQLDRGEALRMKPVQNSAIKTETKKISEDDDDGEEPDEDNQAHTVILIIPRKDDRISRVLARILQAPAERKIELDEINTAIWERCDGNHTVEDLTKFVSSKYKLNRRQAEVSVIAVMKLLSQRRLIGFIKEGKGLSNVNPGHNRAKRRKTSVHKRRY